MENMEIPDFFYGTAWKEEATTGLVTEALTQGFRGIDTANQRVHYHEVAVGEGIAEAIHSGITSRDEIFLQTKFTFQRGQDHRLPYDPEASIAEQVRQSFESSRHHLQTDYLDSYVLHGPSTHEGLTGDDWSAWRSMEEIQAAGGTRLLGVSNVSLNQLKAFCDDAVTAPRFVQNRCFANRRWDKEIRHFCSANNILYQGFSLLTANQQYLRHPVILEICKSRQMSISQTIFRFAIDSGMLPLTGTSKAEHMKHDLLVKDFKLSETDLEAIENIAF